MRKPSLEGKPPSATGKVIRLVRSADPAAPARSTPTTDPRRNYFANSNGSRWGRELRSK